MSDAVDRLLESADRPLHPPPVKPSGRLGSPLANRVRLTFGSGASRRLGAAALLVPAVRRFEQGFGDLPDEKLPGRAHALRGRIRAGEESDELVAEAFGLCSVAVWRVLGMRPYDVQLAAGVVMARGALVELATGEGKTLTATCPVFLHALAGRGVHVATVNDYLAKRDAELMGPVYEKLGLTVGFLQQKFEDAQRKDAYRRDVTYATAAEFGFDFLRDRLKQRGGQVKRTPFWAPFVPSTGPAPADPSVQRGHFCAVVDEADSIFIDEARTPLIIGGPTRLAEPREQIQYLWADGVARKLTPGIDFRPNAKKDKFELTDAGRAAVRYSDPPSGQHVPAMDKLVETVERALQAHYKFVRDHHYMIIEEKVVIVDESTGRPMPDRQWRDGLHQAVEAKEKMPIHFASDHAAQITYQNYFRMYDRLAGMSGTLAPNAKEIRRVYKQHVVCVPTNKPILRQLAPDRVFPTWSAKYDAIVAECVRLTKLGRPVLIGTRSVEKSEALSRRLTAAGVAHQVLNARQNEQEAQIIGAAGQPGRVTVATNMAGRGTDIKLGPGVAKAGGLHVIATERHEGLRIDRQLLGRAGRQGDPGGGQFFLSLEDEVLEGLGADVRAKLEALGKAGGARDWQAFRPLFRKAQRRLERKHLKQRLDMMHYDRQRRELLKDLGADPFVD